MGKLSRKMGRWLWALSNSSPIAIDDYDWEKGLYGHVNPVRKIVLPILATAVLVAGMSHFFLKPKSPSEFEAEQKRKESVQIIVQTPITQQSKTNSFLDWNKYVSQPTQSNDIALRQALAHSDSLRKVQNVQSPQFAQVKETSTIQISRPTYSQSTTPKVKATFARSTVKPTKQKKASTEQRGVIYQDLLEKTGTVFEGTDTLIYTKNGVRVPDSNYVIVVDGERNLPDERLNVKLSSDVLKHPKSHKIRIAKIDPDEKKYESSTPVRLKIPGFEINPIYETVSNDQTRNFQDVIEINIQTKKRFAGNKKENLEQKIVSSSSSNTSSGKINNLDSVVQAASQDRYTMLTSDSIKDVMTIYASTNSRDKNLSKTFAMGLKLGYEPDNINSYKINKDGSMRSDINVVKNLMYGERGNMAFKERALELKKQKLSNEKIAEIMKEETKKYFSNNKGITINKGQVSDSLASLGWISRENYKKDQTRYDTLNTPFTIYNGSMIQTISPAKK